MSFRDDRRLARRGDPRTPGVIAPERLVEIEDVLEVLARVVGLTQQQAELDEREDDVSNVTGSANAPLLEDEARHDAEALEGEVAAGGRELLSGDVATLV